MNVFKLFYSLQFDDDFLVYNQVKTVSTEFKKANEYNISNEKALEANYNVDEHERLEGKWSNLKMYLSQSERHKQLILE